MGRHIAKLGRKTWLGCGFLVWTIALISLKVSVSAAGVGADKSPTNQNPSQVATAVSGGTYVGDSSCLGCHEEERAGYERSPHHWASDPRTPAAKQGCETCHGPGSKHADDPDHVKVPHDFKAMSPADINATCTACHNRGEHALWDGSQHERRDVSCTTCHSLHKPLSEEGSLKAKTETEVCMPCHREKAAKLDRSGHMPLREGKMACSSCHNPHGSTNVKLLKTGNTVNESCTSCHAEKRGPWLFEHAGINGEACSTCHDPHGSSNDRMLVAKLPFLCQRCHNHMKHPSTIYDNKVLQSSNRLFGRSCVTCHSAIHGSNHPSGSTFLRQ